MIWIKIICYLTAVYGISNIMVFGYGPFGIIEWWRISMKKLNYSIGKLFSCMMCLPANIGIVASLIDWFLMKEIAFTPFNIIFEGSNLWWLALILDMGITSGVCWVIYVIDDYFEKNTPEYESEIDDN